ncbi:MAG: Cell division protein FtsX [Elusimicrobia bacterium ADurb.Bin231]|nr:MAG: Cell division protein FtsX [Elusimicrobia bacterium ADurb.Bin231]
MKNLSFLVSFFVAIHITFYGYFIITVKNVSSYFDSLGERVEIILFLNDGLTDMEKDNIFNQLRSDEIIERIEYTSKAEALEELKKDGEFEQQIKILDRNPLPDSIDVFLKLKSPEVIKETAEKLRRIEGVEDIYYTIVEAESLSTIEKTILIFKSWFNILYAVLFIFSSLLVSLAIPKKKPGYGVIDALIGTAFGYALLYFFHKEIFSKIFMNLSFLSRKELIIIAGIFIIAGVIVRLPKNVMEK